MTRGNDFDDPSCNALADAIARCAGEEDFMAEEVYDYLENHSRRLMVVEIVDTLRETGWDILKTPAPEGSRTTISGATEPLYMHVECPDCRRLRSRLKEISRECRWIELELGTLIKNAGAAT